MSTYPRHRNGHVDTGRPVQTSRKCPKCGSSRFRETVSREHCPDCGLECDYWGAGANEVYQDHLEARWEREEREREEAFQRECAEEERQRFLSSLPGDDGDGW